VGTVIVEVEGVGEGLAEYFAECMLKKVWNLL